MKNIPQLDGLRAIAVGLVLLTHFWTYPEGYEVINRIAQAGWIGVDLFFVLSGFLITGILRATRHDNNHYLNFYARRALRIFPPYYLLLVIVLVLLPMLKDGIKVGDEWMFWLYLGNVSIAAAGWQLFLLDITWSLSLEEQFYLVWPATIRKISDDGVITLCIGLILLMPMLRFELWDIMNWRWLHMLMRADSFAVGALIAVTGTRLHRYALPVFALGFYLLASMVVTGHFARDSFFVATIGYSLTAITAGAGLVLSMRGNLLAAKPLRHVGKVSYGVYLFHPICLMAASMVLPEIPGVGGGIIRVVIVSALTIAVATVSFKFYEQPFLRLKDRFGSHSKAAPWTDALPGKPSVLPGLDRD